MSYESNKQYCAKSILDRFRTELINVAAHMFPMMPHFYCFFHIWQNITKHLKAKLGTKFRSFKSYQYMTKVLYPN
uniref:Uncharacterized protein n=1 Tax=Rhizophagus irregularis (strain DAOM 181602 / DAOM 197198 / MUCL 43194) TaxID=747089 RepID=U9UEK8_RHIID